MLTHHAGITRCRTIPCPSDPAPCAADVLMRRQNGSPRRTQATVRSGISDPSHRHPGVWTRETPGLTPDSALPCPRPCATVS